MPFPLSVAHLAGVTAIQLALLLCVVDARLAVLPLGLFVIACLLSPFFPGSRFFMPVVSRGDRRRSQVALSFDDGPDPEVTPRVLELLQARGIQAAFFLVGRKAEAHPELVEAILAGGHEIGNHSYSHDPFLMLRSRRVLREEIARGQAALQAFGILPRAFRPPVGIVTPLLWPVLLAEGLFCLNFSCRAWDAGNRRIRNLAARLLRKVRGGDVVLLHDVRPPQGDPEALITELAAFLDGLADRGLEVVLPSRLLGRAVMARRQGHRGAAEAFYDDLADTYDNEQFETAVAMSRTLELGLFRARRPELMAGARRVLDVGAGTGIFTLELAPHCEVVQAFDLSGNMLRRLAVKAEGAGIRNLDLREGNAEQMPLEGPYDLVTAFLVFEYFEDLGAFLKRLAPHMAPGGRIYFITARTGFLRFWTQVGNAMRQGLWLRSRTRGGVEAMLKAAGAVSVRCEGHLLKGWGFGGMLLEVEAAWPGTREGAGAPGA